MFLRFLSVVILLCAPSFSSAAHAAQNYWQTHEATAYITKELIGDGKKGELTFVISFGRKNNCRSEVGLMFGGPQGVGQFIKIGEAKEDMLLKVGGKSFSERTYLSKYTAGFETMMYANEEIVNKLRSSRDAVLKIAPDSQEFSFPLEGANAAITKAYQFCNSNFFRGN